MGEGEQINLRSTKLYHRIWSHWLQAWRARDVHCSRRAFVELHRGVPSTDCTLGDNPTGHSLDHCARDAPTLPPFESTMQQSVTR
jgi:hypothetical protein